MNTYSQHVITDRVVGMLNIEMDYQDVKRQKHSLRYWE